VAGPPATGGLRRILLCAGECRSRFGQAGPIVAASSGIGRRRVLPVMRSHSLDHPRGPSLPPGRQASPGVDPGLDQRPELLLRFSQSGRASPSPAPQPQATSRRAGHVVLGSVRASFSRLAARRVLGIWLQIWPPGPGGRPSQAIVSGAQGGANPLSRSGTRAWPQIGRSLCHFDPHLPNRPNTITAVRPVPASTTLSYPCVGMWGTVPPCRRRVVWRDWCQLRIANASSNLCFVPLSEQSRAMRSLTSAISSKRCPAWLPECNGFPPSAVRQVSVMRLETQTNGEDCGLW